MKKKDLSYIMYIFLLLFPFIDFVTGIATWEGWLSIGLLVKGLLLVYAVFYLFKHEYKRKPLWVLFFLILGYSIVYLSIHSEAFFTEVSNLIKIFYLPILILFFTYYKNPYLNKKFMTWLLLFYLLLYLVPYVFGLGHNISEVYPNKELYLSYFYIGNELANVFIILIPIAFSYLIMNKKSILLLFIFLVLFMLLLLGTKAMYLSMVFILVYFLWHYRKKIGTFLKSHFKKVLISIVVLLLAIGFYLPRSSLVQNIKTTLEYYEIETLMDMFSLERIDQVIYSNRLTFLHNVHQVYMDSSLSSKFFGLGRVQIEQIKDVEIDIFDIFYSIGIVGTLVYLGTFWYAIYSMKLKGLYLFVFCLLILISCFSGHVLISPMVSTYLALLGSVSKNENS